MNSVHYQGFNGDVDIAAAEDVWSEGVADYPFPAAAAATTIESASANDAAAGTGARTCRVEGLNATFGVIKEDVILNGTSAVTLVNSYLRILSVQVLTAGSGTTNAGKLSVKQSSTVIAAVEAGIGRTRMAIYTASALPRQHRLKRIHLAITNAVAGAAVGQLQTRKAGGVWQVRASIVAYGTNPYAVADIGPFALDAGEDVRIKASATADNTAVVAGFDIDYGSSPNF